MPRRLIRFRSVLAWTPRSLAAPREPVSSQLVCRRMARSYSTTRGDSSRCALNFRTPPTILPTPISKKNPKPTSPPEIAVRPGRDQVGLAGQRANPVCGELRDDARRRDPADRAALFGEPDVAVRPGRDPIDEHLPTARAWD